MSDERPDQPSEEKGIVQYDTPRGQITLTVQIVRRFFCPKATELEALAFAGYCKHSALNPFLREVYLVKYDETEPASIITAYQLFMKRAERAEGYGGFRAGVVLLPDPDAAGESIKGEDLSGIPAPFVALEGTLIPPGYTLAGGWCQVNREGRPPIVSTVRLEEYLQRRRDGKPTRAWERMPATMIRKVPVGQAHRDAWPDELSGLVLEEEGGARIGESDAAPIPDLMPRRVGESAPIPEAPAPPDRSPIEADSPQEVGLESPPESETAPVPLSLAPSAEPILAPEPPPPLAPAPLAPGMVRFLLNNRPIVTAGVTKEQFLKIVKLSAQVDQLCGKGAAKDMLGRECGVEHRTELTEAGAATYLAVLAKRANQAIAERGRA